ncbi:MAG: ribonuclease HII [Spirochaetales bacterium]|nr:ribonuclease HII [Spirochaetales bacterium]
MQLICGVDEAGRGPLAGPVTAGAVILPKGFPTEVLDDSKRLSAKQRDESAQLIMTRSVAWAIGWASHIEIDEINILAATLLAMRRAVQFLDLSPESVIVDGLHTPALPCPANAVVRADSVVPAVMAASILAKTARDAWMIDYSIRDPRYGFERHKGYPTRDHRDRIREHGRCPIHRRSFRVS